MMRYLYTLLIYILLVQNLLAGELNKRPLIEINIETSGIDGLHQLYEGKAVDLFFSKFGKSLVVGGSGITIYYYKAKNGSTIAVGTADSKMVMYVQLAK